MSHFSNALTRLLSGATHAEIAGASGIPRGSITQYASGDRGISVGALGQLLQAFPDAEDQLDLVRAHLRDEIPAEVFDLIDIHTKGPRSGRLQEDAPAPVWKKDLDAALDLLRVRAERDESVRKLILDLEEVLR